jgi:hypothetical protein
LKRPEGLSLSAERTLAGPKSENSDRYAHYSVFKEQSSSRNAHPSRALKSCQPPVRAKLFPLITRLTLLYASRVAGLSGQPDAHFFILGPRRAPIGPSGTEAR